MIPDDVPPDAAAVATPALVVDESTVVGVVTMVVRGPAVGGGPGVVDKGTTAVVVGAAVVLLAVAFGLVTFVLNRKKLMGAVGISLALLALWGGGGFFHGVILGWLSSIDKYRYLSCTRLSSPYGGRGWLPCGWLCGGRAGIGWLRRGGPGGGRRGLAALIGRAGDGCVSDRF